VVERQLAPLPAEHHVLVPELREHGALAAQPLTSTISLTTLLSIGTLLGWLYALS
jgi:hypothetical protein